MVEADQAPRHPMADLKDLSGKADSSAAVPGLAEVDAVLVHSWLSSPYRV